jgi:molybdopterin-guanine dinucleotide biosynthesis protein A
MSRTGLLQIGGYVLAGGRSSRMGTDKAFIELAGKPLIAYATETLRNICAEVSILGSDPKLLPHGRLVPDLHAGCGPIGAIEAALTDSRFDWNLLVPVDVPFLPPELVREWALSVTADLELRVSYFEVGGRAEPGVLLIRRSVRPAISAAIERGDYKLLPALRAAAPGASLRVEPLREDPEQWFTNVNTPLELDEAKRRIERVSRR